MKLKLQNALKLYDRQDTTEVNCGGSWFITLKAMQSCIKELTKEQAKMRTEGDKRLGKNNKVLPSVDLTNTSPEFGIVGEDGETYLLGSYRNDVVFFVQNVLVSWRGLMDDDGVEIPYDENTALQILLESGEPGKRLYQELLAASLDAKLFVKVNNEEAIEEDIKNS